MSPGRPFVGRRFSVELVEHEGQIYDVARGPQAAAIVARTPADDVILVEQYRPAVGQAVLELPAGLIEGTDEPLATALRELREETGYEAATATPLGQGFFAAAGFADERYFLFEGRAGESPVGPTDGEVDRVVLMPMAEAVARARQGGFQDTKTCLGICLASSS